MNNSTCYGTKVRVRLPPRALILKTIIMTKLEKLRKKVKTQNTWTNKRLTFGTTDKIKSSTKPSYSRNALWTYHSNKEYYSHCKWEGLRQA